MHVPPKYFKSFPHLIFEKVCLPGRHHTKGGWVRSYFATRSAEAMSYPSTSWLVFDLTVTF
jgi:hypothetical protein